MERCNSWELENLTVLYISNSQITNDYFVYRVTENKFLEWQCKKTCNLCNVDPDRSVQRRYILHRSKGTGPVVVN